MKKKLSKCIGIVSYLPDNLEIRNHRKNKLLNLIFRCNYLFNLPIIIIAQNYSDSDNDIIEFKNVQAIKYDKPLGITGARKALRKVFLEKDYDYLIMLDDDISITGNDGNNYLNQIDDNPGCFIENNKTRLQLFAISKEIFSKEDFDNINPESGEGFEDRIFVNRLRKKYPDFKRQFTNTGLEEHALATADPDSTWYKNQNLNDMLEKTFKIIDKI